MIIAICGPDGSGKTTYAKFIKKHFDSLNTKSKIVHPFDYFLLRKILDVGKKDKKTSDNNMRKENNNFILKFWPIFSLIDNWIDYLVNMKFYRGQVICERYYYDLATSFAEFGYTFDWLYDIYLLFIPKPDVCIILNTQAKLLKKRETGDKHQIDFFERQTKRYKKIAKKLNYYEINVSETRNVCEKNILKEIYENK